MSHSVITAHVHHSGKVELLHLSPFLEKFMSVISEYAAVQKQFNADLDAKLGAVVASVSNIKDDVGNLNDKIAQLQNSIGETISADDKALLDGLKTDAAAVLAKANGLATVAADVDAMTPPVVPAG